MHNDIIQPHIEIEEGIKEAIINSICSYNIYLEDITEAKLISCKKLSVLLYQLEQEASRIKIFITRLSKISFSPFLLQWHYIVVIYQQIQQNYQDFYNAMKSDIEIPLFMHDLIFEILNKHQELYIFLTEDGPHDIKHEHTTIYYENVVNSMKYYLFLALSGQEYDETKVKNWIRILDWMDQTLKYTHMIINKKY